jgi:hypothetical protein
MAMSSQELTLHLIDIQAIGGFVFAAATLIAVIIGFRRTRLRGFLYLAIGVGLQLLEGVIDYADYSSRYDLPDAAKIGSAVLYFIANGLNVAGMLALAFSARRQVTAPSNQAMQTCG